MNLIFGVYYKLPREIRADLFKDNAPMLKAFAAFLAELKQLVSPDLIVAALEGGVKNFRHQIFPAYKPKRSAMPNNLKLCLPDLFHFLESEGISMMSKKGSEADDVIASVVRSKGNLESNVIVSQDKDFFQLIDDSTLVIRFNDQGFYFIDRKMVYSLYGVNPDQMLDYMSLMGDKVDGIPKIKGIGKRAAKVLLRDWGNLENIFLNIDKINNPRVKQSLIEGKASALHFRELLRL